MEENQNFTFSIYTENNVGILNRLSAIFLKRHINIESFSAFLRGWIKHHFCVIDQEYSKFLIEKGVE